MPIYFNYSSHVVTFLNTGYALYILYTSGIQPSSSSFLFYFILLKGTPDVTSLQLCTTKVAGV
jgi:hypothetical protein